MLPLNITSGNPDGVMFDRFQAALADPIPALACARDFHGGNTVAIRPRGCKKATRPPASGVGVGQ